MDMDTADEVSPRLSRLKTRLLWAAVLTLDAYLLHLRHLRDGLLQVFQELEELLGALGTEVQDLLLVWAKRWEDGDAVRVVCGQRGTLRCWIVAFCHRVLPGQPYGYFTVISREENDLHSFSKRWNCMPRRPMALQKVYAAELFFFGQSFKICNSGERTARNRRCESGSEWQESSLNGFFFFFYLKKYIYY